MTTTVIGEIIESSVEELRIAAEINRSNPTLVNAAYVRRCSRKVLVCAARRIIGGYYIGSNEERAADLLLTTAERIPL